MQEANALSNPHHLNMSLDMINIVKYTKDSFDQSQLFNSKEALNDANLVIRDHVPLFNFVYGLLFMN